MKQQTIGVEIEMNNITRKESAEIVVKHFETEAYNSASLYGYSSWACKDTQESIWKFEKDISIAGDDNHKCERVTPILNYSDIEYLQEIVRLLRKAGTKSDAKPFCRSWLFFTLKDKGICLEYN